MKISLWATVRVAVHVLRARACATAAFFGGASERRSGHPVGGEISRTAHINSRSAWRPVLKPIARLLIAAQLALVLQPLSALAHDKGTRGFNPLADAQVQRLAQVDQRIQQALLVDAGLKTSIALAFIGRFIPSRTAVGLAFGLITSLYGGAAFNGVAMSKACQR